VESQKLKAIKKLIECRQEIEELSKTIEFLGVLVQAREDISLSIIEGVGEALIKERKNVYNRVDLLLPQIYSSDIITLN
jgi:hypothetical protein